MQELLRRRRSHTAHQIEPVAYTAPICCGYINAIQNHEKQVTVNKQLMIHIPL